MRRVDSRGQEGASRGPGGTARARWRWRPPARADTIPPSGGRMSRTKTINLALQGGGAHGAFGWGVLDRLLEDRRLSFEGISATSAGALNATILASAFARDGADGAREALHDFWRKVSQAALLGPLQPSPWDRLR